MSLLGDARREPGTAAQCLYTLIHADPNSEEDWVMGIVGAVLLNDIRLELEAIRKGLSRGK